MGIRETLHQCPGCGNTALETEFIRVPIENDCAVAIHCTGCFRTMPIEDVLDPKVEYILITNEVTYRASVRYLRGVDNVVPAHIIAFQRTREHQEPAFA